MFDETLDAVFISTRDGRFVDANPATTKLLGYTREEMLHTISVAEIYTDAADREAFQRAVETKGWVRNYPVKLVKKDCRRMDCLLTSIVRRAENGRIEGYQIIIHDVTRNRQAERALKESESRYRAIVENTVNGVAVYRAADDGEDFVFVDFNRASERIEKLSRQDVIGKKVTEVFPGVRQFGLLDVLRRVWLGGRPEKHPVSLYQDDRIVGWRDNFVYKLPSGEIVAVYSDQTERKQAEEALRTAHERLHEFSQELEKKVQERTEQLRRTTRQLVEAERLATLGKMANRIAHELRNPLTVVGGYARRLGRQMADGDPNKLYAGIILDAVLELEQKITEIIKMADRWRD